MIFAVIGEELGLIGSTLVIAAFAVFASPASRSRCAAAIRSASSSPPGITALVCGQAAINLAAVLGIAPLTGIPLPFVSYGGSSLVVLLAAVGILLNIAGDGASSAAAVPDRGRGNGRHVLPALAVAEALRARGVNVTFAGSPDRVEAQLVPEAGYELDTFAISGFPRAAVGSRSCARSAQAVRAPFACRGDPRAAAARRRARRRRLRRRADGATRRGAQRSRPR